MMITFVIVNVAIERAHGSIPFLFLLLYASDHWLLVENTQFAIGIENTNYVIRVDKRKPAFFDFGKMRTWSGKDEGYDFVRIVY
jgi:hypothetical protein